MDIQEALRSRSLKLDGAMGTQIQHFNLSEADFRQGLPIDPTRDVKGDNECLNLSRPDVIRSIHQSYVDAGADILETNSFGANAVSQDDYGLAPLAPRMALEAARLARAVADQAPRPVWVAGSMGPTSKSLSLVSDYMRLTWRPLSFDDLAAAYAAQARSLIEGGVDLLQVETCFDALNAKAALYAINQVRPGFPVIVSVSVGSPLGYTLTGQSLEAFFAAVSHYPLLAFGLNCSAGAAGLQPLIEDLSRWCPVPLICYPNAGLPNAQGGYDDTPETMAAQMAALDGQVNIIGGCCGTTPDHIRAFPVLRPRPIPEPDKSLRLSGLQPLVLSEAKGALVGNRTDSTVSEAFRSLISDGELEEASLLAAQQLEEGARLSCIGVDGPEAMEGFVRMSQFDPSVALAPLMISSVDWETLLAGLKNIQGKGIARAISLAEGSDAFVQKALTIRSLGAAMVVRAAGQEEQAFQLLTGAGIPPAEIFFEEAFAYPDPVAFGAQAREWVERIHTRFPGAATLLDLSGLKDVSDPGAYLSEAAETGADLLLADPAWSA